MQTHKKTPVSIFSAIMYFINVFIFEEILLPMFKTITFQRFWKKKERVEGQNILATMFTFVWQIFLFFGAIPFLVFLLGQDNIAGLIISIFLLLYIMYLIFSRGKADRNYQKSVVFLMIPLYYVCMVELFRWAFLFSPEAAKLVPDRSEFLFLGIQNFIRTQLFLDVLDYVKVVNFEVSGYLFLGATFVTRLLLDIAVISLLIQAGVKSHRRTWIYYHTGEQVDDITGKESLYELENIAATGNLKKINKVREYLPKVLRVLGLVKVYAEEIKHRGDEQAQQNAQKCLEYVSQVPLREETSVAQSYSITWQKKLFSMVAIAIWAFGFVWGIQFFIKDIIRLEIKELMEKAQSENYANDPVGKQILYNRVLGKDPQFYDAMMKSAENSIQLAELNERVFNYEQAQINIDEAFTHLIAIDKSEVKKDYVAQLVQKSGEAYTIRGRLFFLQNDFDRSIGELRKLKTKSTRRMLFDVRLYQTSEILGQREAEEYLTLAFQELGFDPDYQYSFFYRLVKGLNSIYNKKQQDFITLVDSVVEENPEEFSKFSHVFTDALAHALVRQGDKNFAQAEKLFAKVYNANEPFVGNEKYSAILGMANLYRLRGNLEPSMDILKQIITDENAPQEYINQANLVMTTIFLQQKDKSNIEKYIKEAVAQHPDVTSFYKQLIQDFFVGLITVDQLLDEAQSWDINTSEKQHAICYYYIGAMYYTQKKYDEAATFWRRCIYMNRNDIAETNQAKQELENLQIQLEGKSYQSELFFDQSYLSNLNQLIKQEIRNKINSQEKTVQALEFLLSTEYEKEKIGALSSIANRASLTGDNFLQLIKKALTDKNKDLKLAAIANLSKLDASMISKIKDELVAELQNEDELVSRSALGVLTRLNDPSVLILALKNEDNKFLRRDAGYALAKLKEKASLAAETLSEKLGDKEIMVRDAAFAAVISLDAEKSAPILKNEVMKKETIDSELQIRALQELAAKHPLVYQEMAETVTPLLVNLLLNSPDVQSSRWAALQLIRLQASDDVLEPQKVRPKLIERLHELLISPDLQTRASTAGWYLNLYDRWEHDVSPAINVFIERWEQGSKVDQLAVARSYLFQKDRICVGSNNVLLAALKHENPRIFSLAQELYTDYVIPEDYGSRITTAIVSSLVTMIKENHSRTETAEELLASYKNDNPEVVVPIMLPFIVDKDDRTRSIIMAALQLESKDYSASEEDGNLLIANLNQEQSILGNVMKVAKAFSVSNREMYPKCTELMNSNNDSVAAAAIHLLANFPDDKEKLEPKLLSILNQKVEDPFADPGDDSDSDEFSDDSGDDSDSDEFSDDSDDDSDSDEFSNDSDDDSDSDEFSDDSDDDSDSDEFSDDSDSDDSEEEEDGAYAKVQAALYTLGVWNGLDYFHDLIIKRPHLASVGMDISYAIQEKLELENTDIMLFFSKFFDSNNDELVSAALAQIDFIEDDREAALPGLKKLQKSSDPDIRKLAQKIILQINPTKDVNLFNQWLSDEDESIQLATLNAMIKLSITEDQLIAKVAKLLTHSSEDIRNKASEVLIRIGSKSIPYLSKYMTHPSPQAQLIAIETLGKMANFAQGEVNNLMKHALSANENVRYATLKTLGNIANPKNRSLLTPCKKILGNKKTTFKTKVVTWVLIAKIGEKERALNTLLEMLHTETNDQLFIIENLQKVDIDYTVQYLKQVIRKRYGSIKVVTAISALEKLESEAKSAIPVLTEMALDPNPEFRQAAQNALTKIK